MGGILLYLKGLTRVMALLLSTNENQPNEEPRNLSLTIRDKNVTGYSLWLRMPYKDLFPVFAYLWDQYHWSLRIRIMGGMLTLCWWLSFATDRQVLHTTPNLTWSMCSSNLSRTKLRGSSSKLAQSATFVIAKPKSVVYLRTLHHK